MKNKNDEKEFNYVMPIEAFIDRKDELPIIKPKKKKKKKNDEVITQTFILEFD